MIRTREFVVIVAMIMFLVIGIGLTVAFDGRQWTGQLASVAGNIAYTPVVGDDEVISADYETALSSMRERLLAYRTNIAIDKEQFIVREIPDGNEVQASATLDTDEQSVLVCSGYSTFQQVWPAHVRIAEREGARIVYIPEDSQSASEAPGAEDTVLAQLPVQTQPAVQPSCLQHDVVGIARDGSLIRNNEHGLYSVFSASTVVGYALDGFPIYGREDLVAVDRCGGGYGSQGYGYVLQSDRETILNCFSGIPATL